MLPALVRTFDLACGHPGDGTLDAYFHKPRGKIIWSRNAARKEHLAMMIAIGRQYNLACPFEHRTSGGTRQLGKISCLAGEL